MFQIEKQYIRTLFELGHFYNPATPNGHNVLIKDLDTLTLNHQLVKDAVRSLQDMGGEVFNQICLKHHGRNASFDGEFGPATNQLFNTPRCGQPDYKLPEKIGQKKLTGSGSWPSACAKSGVKIYYNKANIPSSIKDKWLAIQIEVFKAYADIGLKLVEVSNASEANIRVSWKVLVGSTIGLAYYNNQSCSDVVDQYLDPGYTQYMFELHAHETGHNCNLDHCGGGKSIMSPYIVPVTPHAWNDWDCSYSVLKRYFDGKPVDPVEPTLELKVVGQPKGTTKVVVDFTQKEVQATVNNFVRKFALISNDII
jgi:hypothetical protein